MTSFILAVTSHGNKSLLIPAGIGLAVFVGLHVVFVMTWERLFSWTQVHDAWWLNSGKSVEPTLATLFFAALAASLDWDSPANRGQDSTTSRRAALNAARVSRENARILAEIRVICAEPDCRESAFVVIRLNQAEFFGMTSPGPVSIFLPYTWF